MGARGLLRSTSSALVLDTHEGGGTSTDRQLQQCGPQISVDETCNGSTYEMRDIGAYGNNYGMLGQSFRVMSTGTLDKMSVFLAGSGAAGSSSKWQMYLQSGTPTAMAGLGTNIAVSGVVTVDSNDPGQFFDFQFNQYPAPQLYSSTLYSWVLVQHESGSYTDAAQFLRCSSVSEVAISAPDAHGYWGSGVNTFPVATSDNDHAFKLYMNGWFECPTAGSTPIPVPQFEITTSPADAAFGDTLDVTVEGVEAGDYTLSIRAANCEDPVAGIFWKTGDPNNTPAVKSTNPDTSGKITEVASIDFSTAYKTSVDTDGDSTNDVAEIKFCVVAQLVESGISGGNAFDHAIASNAGIATITYEMNDLNHDDTAIVSLNSQEAPTNAYEGDGTLTIEGYHCDEAGDILNDAIGAYNPVFYCTKPLRAGWSFNWYNDLHIEWTKSSDGVVKSLEVVTDNQRSSSSSLVEFVRTDVPGKPEVGQVKLKYLPIDVFRDSAAVTFKGSGNLDPINRRANEIGETDSIFANSDSFDDEDDQRRLYADASTRAKFASLLEVDTTSVNQGPNLSVGLLVGIVAGTACALLGCAFIVIAGKKKRGNDDDTENDEEAMKEVYEPRKPAPPAPMRSKAHHPSRSARPPSSVLPPARPTPGARVSNDSFQSDYY